MCLFVYSLPGISLQSLPITDLAMPVVVLCFMLLYCLSAAYFFSLQAALASVLISISFWYMQYV